MHCALAILRGEMLILGDIAEGIFAVPFDGNVTVGYIAGKSLLADIVFGDGVPCNRIAKGEMSWGRGCAMQW